MDNTINILMIEDNPGDIRLVQEALKEVRDFHVNLIIADRLAQGLKTIATKSVHVILLDLNLPDSQSIVTFKQVHKFSLNIPIIILSVLSQKEIIYEAMLEGAQDYLIKGEIENEALVRSIRYAIWRSSEVTKEE